MLNKESIREMEELQDELFQEFRKATTVEKLKGLLHRIFIVSCAGIDNLEERQSNAVKAGDHATASEMQHCQMIIYASHIRPWTKVINELSKGKSATFLAFLEKRYLSTVNEAPTIYKTPQKDKHDNNS